MSIKKLYPDLKLQLKARYRLSSFLDSKNIEQEKPNPDKFFKLLKIDNNDPFPPKKPKKKSVFTNYHKYKIKTNLLKKIVLNMPIKEMYKYEKDCSLKCADTLKEIQLYTNKINIPKLPKIENKRNNLSANNIKIHKVNVSNKSNEKSYCSDSTMANCISMPSIFSPKKISISSNSHIFKKKPKIDYSNNKNGNNNILCNIFNIKNNFQIIKGGGIKYNNSIFRYKNMNNLLNSKSLQIL